MLLSFPLPERLSGGSASALSALNDGSVSVGLVKPSNTEPLCGAWVVSLGFSRSFVLCFKWDPHLGPDDNADLSLLQSWILLLLKDCRNADFWLYSYCSCLFDKKQLQVCFSCFEKEDLHCCSLCSRRFILLNKNPCKLRDNMSKSLFEKFQPNLWLANLMLDGTPVQVAAKQIGTKT